MSDLIFWLDHPGELYVVVTVLPNDTNFLFFYTGDIVNHQYRLFSWVEGRDNSEEALNNPQFFNRLDGWLFGLGREMIRNGF